jgi:soluble lytic murein transglycosylase-like protein
LDSLKSRYDSLFEAYGNLVDVDWKLLRAQAMIESNLNPRARSKAGAKGLAQFMDDTWAEYGHGDPFNPEESIAAQAAYMSHLLKLYDGDKRLALAAYNGGPTKLKRVGYECMPAETKSYVFKVLRLYD